MSMPKEVVSALNELRKAAPYSHRFVRIDGKLVFAPDEDQEGLFQTRKRVLQEGNELETN